MSACWRYCLHACMWQTDFSITSGCLAISPSHKNNSHRLHVPSSLDWQFVGKTITAPELCKGTGAEVFEAGIISHLSSYLHSVSRLLIKHADIDLYEIQVSLISFFPDFCGRNSIVQDWSQLPFMRCFRLYCRLCKHHCRMACFPSFVCHWKYWKRQELSTL